LRRLAIIAVLLLSAQPALAQVLAEGTLTLGGKLVPLPPGAWRVLHQGTEPTRTTDGSIPTTMHRALLVQERDGRAAAVIVAAAAAEVGTSWNPHGVCVNANAIQRDIRQAVRGALDCTGLVVIGSGRGSNTPAYLNALYDEGDRRPGWIPPRWISVQIVQSERMHYLSVEYRYAPAVFAPATANAANWNEGARNAAQQDVVQRLAGFAARARTELQRGSQGRPPSAPLASPF
jgi:hypothetical protein